jgi:RNA polymerase-interacting CarD/CdnL/TRCF family regulator
VTPLALAVGDPVVYGAHGAGSIVARETQDVDGRAEVVIVLALARGLSVSLPLELAERQLRPVADETQIGRVRAILAADAAPNGDHWLQRQRETREKLGSTLGLAEILRDRADRGARSGSRPAPSEREIVKRAHELLAGEIALARGVELADARVWIDAQLA